MFAGALLEAETVPPRRWAGAGLALAGLALIALPGAAAPPPGPVALMAAAGLGWGVYSLAGRKAADPLAATAWNFILALPPALALIAVVPVAPPYASGVLLALVSGAVTSGLGYALWYALVPRLGAARAGVAQLSVPVLAAAGGAALLAEPPGWRFALASLLVLGGVALASLGYSGLRSRKT
ncbi:MAG: DMT family transporter [Paracoccaceae bacterium]